MSTTHAPGRPVFDHLMALSDGHGLFEHALHDRPARRVGRAHAAGRAVFSWLTASR